MILGMQVWMTSHGHMGENTEAIILKLNGSPVHGLSSVGTATCLHAVVVYNTVGILKPPTTALELKSIKPCSVNVVAMRAIIRSHSHSQQKHN